MERHRDLCVRLCVCGVLRKYLVKGKVKKGDKERDESQTSFLRVRAKRVTLFLENDSEVGALVPSFNFNLFFIWFWLVLRSHGRKKRMTSV